MAPTDAPRDSSEAVRQREVMRELYRMDRVLESPPPPPPAQSTNAPMSPLPLGGGGRPQPTPAEIEERAADRKPPPQPTIKLNPVYDLFGERLQ